MTIGSADDSGSARTTRDVTSEHADAEMSRGPPRRIDCASKACDADVNRPASPSRTLDLPTVTSIFWHSDRSVECLLHDRWCGWDVGHVDAVMHRPAAAPLPAAAAAPTRASRRVVRPPGAPRRSAGRRVRARRRRVRGRRRRRRGGRVATPPADGLHGRGRVRRVRRSRRGRRAGLPSTPRSRRLPRAAPRTPRGAAGGGTAGGGGGGAGGGGGGAAPSRRRRDASMRSCARAIDDAISSGASVAYHDRPPKSGVVVVNFAPADPPATSSDARPAGTRPSPSPSFSSRPQSQDVLARHPTRPAQRRAPGDAGKRQGDPAPTRRRREHAAPRRGALRLALCQGLRLRADRL